MIVFDLKCRNGHQFEAWFNSASGFERLKKTGHVACSVCGSSKIEKALNAPNIAPSKRKAAAPPAAADKGVPDKSESAKPAPALNGPGRYATDPAAAKIGEMMKQVHELRVQVEKNCDYVGPEFAEEARKMHYGETPRRNIYGEASDGDAQALAEEGIEISRIPWPVRRDS